MLRDKKWQYKGYEIEVQVDRYNDYLEAKCIVYIPYCENEDEESLWVMYANPYDNVKKIVEDWIDNGFVSV